MRDKQKILVLVHSTFKLLYDSIFCILYYFIKILSPFQRHVGLAWSVIGPFTLIIFGVQIIIEI